MIFGSIQMEVLHLFELAFDQVKVVSNLSLDFSTVQEHKELWFDSGVEVELNLWGGITVDLDVGETRIIRSKFIVISVELFADWVPLSVEVNAGKLWTLGIKELNKVVD